MSLPLRPQSPSHVLAAVRSGYANPTDRSPYPVVQFAGATMAEARRNSGFRWTRWFLVNLDWMENGWVRLMRPRVGWFLPPRSVASRRKSSAQMLPSLPPKWLWIPSPSQVLVSLFIPVVSSSYLIHKIKN